MIASGLTLAQQHNTATFLLVVRAPQGSPPVMSLI